MPIPTTYTWPLIPPAPVPPPPSGSSPSPLFGTEMHQSAISEGGDQIFLDTADENRLNVVTSNLGLTRPISGFDDDEWRAHAKKIMLVPKLIRKIFVDILDVCVGPQFSRIANLSAAAAVGDLVVAVADASELIQVGQLVFDKNTALEETVDYVFVDYINNLVFLETGLRFTHAVVADADNRLRSTINAGSLTLPLVNSSLFPTTGFPYIVLIDQGTENEEAVVVTANNTGTNTLTCSATLKTHYGPVSSYFHTKINLGTPAGRNFLVFAPEVTRHFPETGFIRINKGQANEEVLEYDFNDVANNILMLVGLLAFPHTINEPVDLVEPGAPVSTATLIEPGIYWDIFETKQDTLYFFVPPSISSLRLIDTSWFHGPVPAPFATTLASNAGPSDTQLTLTSVSGLPDEAGMLELGGVQKVFYIFRDQATNQVYLDRALGNNYLAGAAVQLFTVPYPGTSLEEGNPRNASGDRQFFRFPGPYIFHITEVGPSSFGSTLTTLTPPKTTVAFSQLAFRTNLEVVDVSLWPTPPYTVRLGRDSGFQEDRTVSDVTLKKDAATTVNGNHLAGVSSILGVNTTSFPTSDGVHGAGYRIQIDNEILTINQNSLNTFTILPDADHPAGVTNDPHSNGADIRLLNDVLTFDTLTKPHTGPVFTPAKVGQLVEPLVAKLTVFSSAQFPTTGGVVWVNFGKEKRDASSKIVSSGGPTSYTLVDTTKFPVVDFPYQVVIGAGLASEERVYVTANAANTLTLQAPGTLNSHSADENVEFTSGDPEPIEYIGVSGNDLLFTEPMLLDFKHLVGERVMLSTAPSVPRADGFSYDWKLPPDLSACFTDLFDLVKAAGVQIIITDSR